MAALTTQIYRMTVEDANACWALNKRCFEAGEVYDRETFHYLLSHTNAVSYKILDSQGVMLAFLVGLIEFDGTGHIITLGVVPEYRRQGAAQRLLDFAESGFRFRRIITLRLEVQIENIAAQRLYMKHGFKIVERLEQYYTSGNDGYLMVKAIGDLSPPEYATNE